MTQPAAAPMTQRQAFFRGDFRERISPWYVGPLHVLMIYSIGIAGIVYFVRQIGTPAWYEWLIVPLAFTVANVFEWWIHRYVMHRPRQDPFNFCMGIYKRHTLAHHQFFTKEEVSIDGQRDFRITFFPPYALIAFMMISAAPAWVLMLLGFADAGWLLLTTNVFLYLNYELFHYCCHVKDDRIVRHIPFVNTIRRHHLGHHNMAIMMEKNFNLTYPIADWLFGTSDLDRGFLGHVFNGNSWRHVKRNLKRVRQSVDDPMAGTVRA
jgi:sterol desaturase/sphingolipid hydroxylase (fatty acid hydroxylase superfamily)